MKMRGFKQVLSLLLSVAVLSTAIPMTAMQADAANMISNSTFDNGTSGWGTYKESGGACTLSTNNGRLALTVSNVGKVNYAVQVFYDIVPLYQNGVYRLKFDISSSIDRYVEAMIQQNGGTYQAYTWKGLNLTSAPQSVETTFTMAAETDIMSKLVFNCGIQNKQELPEHTIYLDNVSLELVDDSKVDYSATAVYEPPIVTNQVGYQTNREKKAVIRNVSGNPASVTCTVVNADTGAKVYSAASTGGTQNTSANEVDYVFDFSSVTTAGTYYIQCDAVADDSYPFTISDQPYSGLLDDTVRMLYLQRCGTAVQDSTFSHAACHNTPAVIYGTNQTIDVSGGWHDAGDYGRYIVPAAKTIADLLYAYAENPALFSDNGNIPESGNGVPDVLDEARYELEWMLKMQASSGGVYHKVTCESFPGYVAPEEETEQLIVTSVSTTATADFCASMALAHEFYRDIDADFAQTCLTAAERAWAFLQNNPNFIFSNPADITTGEYGDTTDADERYWAAAQLYRATGKSTYDSALQAMSVKQGMDWSTVGDYGSIAILTMDGIDTTSYIYTAAKNKIIAQADSFVTTGGKTAYGVAISKYNWGSNMTIANAGALLGLAYQLTGTESYLSAAEAQLDYLLGKNPLGECFVTGYGTVSPAHPHHRPSMVKNTAMPGMLVGGVNSSLEDSAAKAYLANAASAKCYVDNAESYSTNEITIYWNSPLVYLLSLTSDAKAGGDVKGDVNADGAVKIQDAVMMQKYLLREGTLTSPQNGDMNNDGIIDAFDLLQIKRKLLGA